MPAGGGAPSKCTPGRAGAIADGERSAARGTVEFARVSGELLSIRSERRDDAYYVAPVGELDIATAESLEAELRAAEASDAAMIVLDLSGLSFMDSTGLRVVLDFNERCGGEADRLRVIAGAPAVDRLLDIVGLRERLPLITP